MKRYIISLLLFTGILHTKEYQIACTAIIEGERTCFVDASEGRITFTIPCECDCREAIEEIESNPEYVDDYEYPPEDLIPTESVMLQHK